MARRRDPDVRTFATGGVTLGVGLGGLADGIVLHHVLQWHNLVSGRVSNTTIGGLRANLFWDGVFHLATAAFAVTGAALLWRAAARRPELAAANGAALAGLVLVGWGVFHVVDHLLFHLALGLHDIRDGGGAAYNWLFFAIGLLVAGAGAGILRRRRPLPGATAATPSG